MIKEYLVEFNQLAIEAADGSHDMINRVMTKDNIGLAALLETTESIWENGASICLFILLSQICFILPNIVGKDSVCFQVLFYHYLT